MKTYVIYVENIKCSGCMNSIKTALIKIKGVTAVDISKEEDKVSISGMEVNKEEVVMKLASLGYPEKGNNSLVSKAKSFVSCAVGRYDKINDETDKFQ